jgi:hypothetical protein
MKNSLFMIISSFLPLTLLGLSAEGNPAFAQPQGGQPQGGQPQMGQSPKGASSLQGFEAFSLPSGPIAENDIPGIKTVIQQALSKVSESKKSAGKSSDYQAIKSGILSFQDWLKAQGCVSKASTTYNLEATDKYSENIFMVYPGQLPFDIVFNMGKDIQKQYRLLIFVSTVDFLDFASLVENKSLGGVPALKNWPKSYMDVRPRI